MNDPWLMLNRLWLSPVIFLSIVVSFVAVICTSYLNIYLTLIVGKGGKERKPYRGREGEQGGLVWQEIGLKVTTIK